jgi:phytanoyl-CoA hydroxylase
MATTVVQRVAPPVLKGSVDECFPEGLAQNGGRIPTERVGFLKPTPASLPIDEMRQRLKRDGYLFVKGLIPREDVLDMRERYFCCPLPIS